MTCCQIPSARGPLLPTNVVTCWARVWGRICLVSVFVPASGLRQVRAELCTTSWQVHAVSRCVAVGPATAKKPWLSTPVVPRKLAAAGLGYM